jgi:hypothetical protein
LSGKRGELFLKKSAREKQVFMYGGHLIKNSTYCGKSVEIWKGLCIIELRNFFKRRML